MKQIAFITDLHLNEPLPDGHFVEPFQHLQFVLADIEKRKITEIVFGGDIGDASAHNDFFVALKPFSVHLILGNHDRYEQVQSHFAKGMDRKELYYKVEFQQYVSLFLDSSSGSISDNQLDWLQRELRSSKRKILNVHHPVLPIDTPADKAFLLENRNELDSILRECDEAVNVFCGHYHMNDERELGNIKQFCTPSMAFQLVKNSAEISFDSSGYGYRVIELFEDRIDTHLVEFRSNVRVSKSLT